MAVRDVVDTDGTTWKVWAVMSSAIHPKTAAEDYLGEYSEGWLCFEGANSRRRLAHFPQNWDKLPDKELLRLLDSPGGTAAKDRTTPSPSERARTMTVPRPAQQLDGGG